jgi:hypothetical protein
MPKDTPIGDLVKDAAAHCKKLDGFAKSAADQAKEIDTGFRKSNPDYDVMTQTIERAAKWVGEIEHDMAAAEKTMKQLAKRKEPEAKNATKDLDKAFEGAEKAVSELRGTIAVTEKLADKIWNDDKKMIQAMKTARALGRQRLADCSADAVNCPAIVQNLGNTVAKVKAQALPVAYYMQVLKTFLHDMNEVKTHLDESDRITEALGKLATAAGRASLPEAIELGEDCASLKQKLDAELAKVRPQYKEGLTSAAKWRDELEEKIKTAA